MLGWGLMPLGALTGGYIAQVAGLRAPYTIAGIIRGLALIAIVPALFAARQALAHPEVGDAAMRASEAAPRG
jgi:hypothetical protein